MNSWLQFVLAVLATYRLAYMLSTEEGPFDVFTRLREWAGAYNYADNGQPEANLGRLVSCPLCVGVYMALLVTALVVWPTWLGNAVLIWIGLAGAQAIVYKLTER